MEEDQGANQENVVLPVPQPQMKSNLGVFSMPNFPMSISPVVLPASEQNSMEELTLGLSNQPKTSTNLIRPIPVLPVPPSSKMADLNLNQTSSATDLLPLSLKLSTPMSPDKPAASRSSAFQAMSSGDNIISVA